MSQNGICRRVVTQKITSIDNIVTNNACSVFWPFFEHSCLSSAIVISNGLCFVYFVSHLLRLTWQFWSISRQFFGGVGWGGGGW